MHGMWPEPRGVRARGSYWDALGVGAAGLGHAGRQGQGGVAHAHTCMHTTFTFIGWDGVA